MNTVDLYLLLDNDGMDRSYGKKGLLELMKGFVELTGMVKTLLSSSMWDGGSGSGILMTAVSRRSIKSSDAVRTLPAFFARLAFFFPLKAARTKVMKRRTCGTISKMKPATAISPVMIALKNQTKSNIISLRSVAYLRCLQKINRKMSDNDISESSCDAVNSANLTVFSVSIWGTEIFVLDKSGPKSVLPQSSEIFACSNINFSVTSSAIRQLAVLSAYKLYTHSLETQSRQVLNWLHILPVDQQVKQLYFSVLIYAAFECDLFVGI